MPLYPEGKLLCMGTRVVTISVGIEPDYEDFTVHENLIRRSSGLINAIVSANEDELKEGPIVLTEYRPKDFMIYIQWLYTERVLMEAEGLAKLVQEGRKLIKGYLLGCHLDDEDYRDTLMDCLMEWGDRTDAEDFATLLSEIIRPVFKSTDTNNPLRKFIADYTVWNTDYEYWANNYQLFPDRFVAMVSLGNSYRCHLDGSGPSDRAKEQPCLYHCHEDRICYKESSKRISDCTPQPRRVPRKRVAKKRARSNSIVEIKSESPSSDIFDSPNIFDFV